MQLWFAPLKAMNHKSRDSQSVVSVMSLSFVGFELGYDPFGSETRGKYS